MGPLAQLRLVHAIGFVLRGHRVPTNWLAKQVYNKLLAGGLAALAGHRGTPLLTGSANVD